MNDEKSELQELAAQVAALSEEKEVIVGALQLVYGRVVEIEKALLALHERQADLEAAMRRQLEVMQVAIDGLADVLRRWGGKPPSAPPPLSGVN
jgi:chromosome segregation ATPase